MILLLISLTALPLYAQDAPDFVWQRYWNGGGFFESATCYDLLPHEDGVIAFGIGIGTDEEYYFVSVVFDADGNEIESNWFPYIWRFVKINAAFANENGYIISGGNQLFKIDENLDLVWRINYGHIRFTQMGNILARDDGYIVVGTVPDSISMSRTWVTSSKVSEDGEILWQQRYGNGENEFKSDHITSSPNGGYFISGKNDDSPWGPETWIIEIGEEGDSLRVLSYNQYSNSTAFISSEREGLFKITGKIVQYLDYENGERTRLGDLGEFFPRKKIYDVSKFDNHGGILTGFHNRIDEWGNEIDFRLFLLRFDEDFNRRWMLQRSVGFYEGGRAVIQAPNQGYYLAGSMRDSLYVALTESDPVTVHELITPSFPGLFNLGPAYPNPFNCEANIPFFLSKPGEIQLEVFDHTGRLLFCNSRYFNAGNNQFRLNGKGFPTGEYVVVGRFGDRVESRKVVLVK
ncbi:MAG: T9SS type A sorting domain-containing protein [Calditrichaeota bacterium]|nr:T9SS type A sorting domain-containing protein [Calditrichota bacterium]